MQLGMIGLGRMGANMARRLMRDGHQCVVYDRSADTVKALAAEGATGCDSLAGLVARLAKPRAVWVMVPAGAPTESTVTELGNVLEPGDTVIDGGNTFFKDDIRRARALAGKQITYVDAGTSGGVFGLERGYCLMVGGDRATVQRLDPIFKTLAPGRGSVERTPGREAGKAGTTAEDGYLHCGPVGAGHFVKMVHNGIEYGIMQALAEGFDIMRGAGNPTVAEEHRFDLPVAEIAEVWRRGSVLSSWLVDLTARALVEDPALSKFSGHVQDSGEGRWTVMAAIEEAVPADVIATSLFTRFRSRQEQSFAEKVLSAMRFQFGGHVERPTGG
ncbi:MAG: decarboxylating 6-phosphogluconate dehydrogenase [Deltaproteobacteria bacterium]|nr:MAG: decarboxylating 6-phosphogluconate dehydrogenase [Deltaproteobacteria bacterium]TMQ27138.1 MAG: decarboxylating 6-phosphogluconate dehydrogenase [Deltaproteobacteria bacterium]